MRTERAINITSPSAKQTLAHELRLALTVARGNTELLLRRLEHETDDADDLRRLGEQALAALTRLDAIIARRLDP